MTIIQPNKNQYRFHGPLILAVAFLACLAVFNVYFYNQNVNLGHAINRGLKDVQTLRVANVDYKDRFYKILDSKNIQGIAREKGLIQEKNPGYVEQGSGSLASN